MPQAEGVITKTADYLLPRALTCINMAGLLTFAFVSLISTVLVQRHSGIRSKI
jgi:hypothetical protein